MSWQREGFGVFDSRATAMEFLDRPDCDPALAAASYRFMETVNRRFGGIGVVRRFLAAEASGHPAGAPLRVLDIGSGSCDIPLAVSRWARARGISLRFTCLEMAGHAVDIARGRLARAGDPTVHLLQEDAFAHQPAQPYDCAVASMCFHHFSNEQILALMQRLRGFVLGGVLINDLRRSRLASLATRLLLAGAGAPAGVRHDALLSIRRGFKIGELNALLRQLDGVAVSVESARWFRIAAIIRFKQRENS
jgi:SAM-dependent methyltransferase